MMLTSSISKSLLQKFLNCHAQMNDFWHRLLQWMTKHLIKRMWILFNYFVIMGLFKENWEKHITYFLWWWWLISCLSFFMWICLNNQLASIKLSTCICFWSPQSDKHFNYTWFCGVLSFKLYRIWSSRSEDPQILLSVKRCQTP